MAFVFNKSTPATGAEAIFNLKACLKAAGWTVTSSSDGTTYNASGDQITVATSGAGGMANNSAWFVIQSPAGAGAQQFCWQRGTTNLVWRLKRSRTAGFTGGTPGITIVPSATDEYLLLGAGTDAAPTFAGYHATDGLYRWNVAADNASPYGFWAGAIPTGGGSPGAGICLEPLIGTDPTDADQYIIHLACTNQNCYLSAAITAESGAATSNQTVSQVISTSPGANYAQFPGLTFNTSSGGIYIPDGLPTNPISTKDEAFPILFARRSTLPTPGFKGISTIMRWRGLSRTSGDTLTVSTTRDRIVYGQVTLPWDGSVPSV